MGQKELTRRPSEPGRTPMTTTAPEQHKQRREPAVAVSRCRDGETIAAILARDYFDEPVRSFPAFLKRAFARRWCARADGLYFVTAEVAGEYAGFVFAHTMGDALFKRFARAHPAYLPPLAWTLLKMRAGGLPARRRAAGAESSPARPDAEALAALALPNLPGPFEWSPADGRTGRIGLVFVSPRQRGRGIAARLLEAVVREMAADRVESVEAHIDPTNLPSVRTFLKAGWSVGRASGGDFLAHVRAAR
jgi:GNAT superfamily N-acetyltransferase